MYDALLLIIGIVAADRLVKILTIRALLPGESIPVLDGFFHITRHHNTGAAFSTLLGQQTFLILLTGALLLVALGTLFWKGRAWPRLPRMALAMIIGGGIGNLIDRIGQGYVVDMLDFRVFPIFNVADCFVTVGCALLVLCVLLGNGKENHPTAADGERKQTA